MDDKYLIIDIGSKYHKMSSIMRSRPFIAIRPKNESDDLYVLRHDPGRNVLLIRESWNLTSMQRIWNTAHMWYKSGAAGGKNCNAICIA